MKKETVNVKWLEGMAFEADIEGFKLHIDADPDVGGKSTGPKPKPLMMVALAGCTGMDIASLMNKMRVEYESLNIRVESEVTEEHPKHYTKMKVIYEIKGKDIDIKKVQKAVDLSKEKYCGVSYSYKKVMDLEYEIRILDQEKKISA
jgi:putative redox protein